MPRYGFVRVAAAVPELHVADCQFNAERTCLLLQAAADQQVDIVVFPECGLTGYTCADLFHQPVLLRAAETALETVLAFSAEHFAGLAVVGLPVQWDGQVFNVAAVLQQGKLLGVIPKSYLPTYKEFYDHRYFAPARQATSDTITLAGQTAPWGIDLLFPSRECPECSVGVEICEDLWMPIPPSTQQALAGATVLLNLSASNETIGKAAYRKQLVTAHSARCIAGYVYASAGTGESTTELVFGGHAMIAENGVLLAESARYRPEGGLTVCELDLEHLQRDRVQMNTFHESESVRHTTPPFRRVMFTLPERSERFTLTRSIDAHPFVPDDPRTRDERCAEIFHTQVSGLAKRLDHIGRPPVVIGVSGGLDSTLGLLVACNTMDALGLPRTQIRGLTMPGFGTTERTRANALALMRHLGVTAREVDIRQLCLDAMLALNHAPFGIPLQGESLESLTAKLHRLPAEKRHDLVFENVQARTRTQLLMNTGFTIGTGDMSELALGWCTYNADHMSMYNPNVSVPKTLVAFLVRWVAEQTCDGDAREILLDIAETEISPELLPLASDGSGAQSTEATIGPYELHDFFLYHLLRWGTSPRKIVYLAEQTTFHRDYSRDELRHWLGVFLKRFFVNQYKRSCIPDGPKVGSVSLSPRGDWRMPSDASVQAWLADLALAD